MIGVAAVRSSDGIEAVHGDAPVLTIPCYIWYSVHQNVSVMFLCYCCSRYSVVSGYFVAY